MEKGCRKKTVSSNTVGWWGSWYVSAWPLDGKQRLLENLKLQACLYMGNEFKFTVWPFLFSVNVKRISRFDRSVYSNSPKGCCLHPTPQRIPTYKGLLKTNPWPTLTPNKSQNQRKTNSECDSRGSQIIK